MRVPPRSQASWARLRVSAENAQTINYRVSWTKPAPLGYVFIGEFTDNLIFLECETGEIVYVEHDFYTISSQTEIENIKE